MDEKIRNICAKLEKQQDIKILFAIENGSRAWRMHSKDSDYDVRFVFVRPLEKYLTIKDPDDVIEASFDKDAKPCAAQGAIIDMSGFDIFKFSKMLASSNPTMIEWLMSDIIYFGKQNVAFKKYAILHFSKLALYHHYKSMCKQNYLKYLKSGQLVTYKKYLYAYRGLINAKWVANKGTVPPIIFSEALSRMQNIIPDNIISRINSIIRIKSSGKEKDQVKNIKEMDEYIENFLKDNSEEPTDDKRVAFDLLDGEIQKILLKKKN